MLIAGSSITKETALSAQICIIGTGIAGLIMAHELIGSGLDVVLLESGDLHLNTSTQDLNEGYVIGDDYAGLSTTRHRQFGGTVNLWNTPVREDLGAKYVPLDQYDFHRHVEGGIPGWPLDYSDLTPFYARAQKLCGLGSFNYSADAWRTNQSCPFPLHGSSLTTRVYQFGSKNSLLQKIGSAIRDAENINLVTGTTVCSLKSDRPQRISDAHAITTGGAFVRIHASVFVLACGAVENARLLLLSKIKTPSLFRSTSAWIGRCFMEHPRDSSLSLPTDSNDLFRKAAYYDTHVPQQEVVTCGRLALLEESLAASDLPNFSVTFLPRARPFGLMRRFTNKLRPMKPLKGHGWSRLEDPIRYYDGLNLLINLEQTPNPDNRIGLSSTKDSLGLPRPELHWRWDAWSQSKLEKIRSIITSEISLAGIGKVTADRSLVPDPNAHHHAGTTRMSSDPKYGVVDTDCRMHEMDNLYASGASVFPTAGYANPALTIAAMSIRLSDCLKQRV